MKERKKQKLAKMLDNDYGSAEDVQETTKDTSTDETITKLSQLEKTYEEKKKVKTLISNQYITFLCSPSDVALLNSVKDQKHSLFFLVRMFMHWCTIYKLQLNC